MKPRLSLGALAVALFGGGLAAQDLGTLAVHVGNPDRGNAAAEAAFQARSVEAQLTLGQDQTLITGFVDHRQPLGTAWVNSANWFRTSMAASATARQMLPILSIGLADAVTSDPVAQMTAIGNPQDAVYGPVFQNIISGFRTSGFNKLYLRIGWEHNGEWYPWATTNQDKTPNPARTAAFLAAWRRVANLAHNLPGLTVLTVWSPNFERLTPAQVAATYPGDEYVDIIAPDMYSPIWNAIPENWDPALGGTSPEAVWKANLVNRQHTWDFPSASLEDPTAGYGLVAMLQFALERDKPFGLGETGTDGGPSGGIDRGPEDRGDFPLYLAKRIAGMRAAGLRFAYLGLWNSGAYRFSGGARMQDTGAWVTLLNELAGADPLQVEDLVAVAASDPVTTLADVGATGNYVPDPSRLYIRESDLGGDISKLDANAVNDFVEYLVPVATPGSYTIQVRAKRHFSRGQFRLLVDGVDQGVVRDFYAPANDYLIVDFGRRNFPTAGNKTFRLVAVGRHPDSTGYSLALDYFDLTPERREVELLANGSMSDGTTTYFETAASNGVAERFDANAPGDYIEYIVPIIEPGTYAVKVRAKRHNARGQFQLRVEGAYQGFVQDLYAPYGTTDPYVEIDLGTKTFGLAGEKVFRFTVTGKHPASLGYWLAFDYLIVTSQ